jgi:hypothetical protein
MNGTCCIGVIHSDTWNAAQARSKRECGEGYGMKENNYANQGNRVIGVRTMSKFHLIDCMEYKNV